MSETDFSREHIHTPESELDEDDRLKPEFVRAVLAAVEAGDAEAAREKVERLHPADIADLIELTPGDQRAAAEAILITQDRIIGVQGLAGTGQSRMPSQVYSMCR